MMRKSMEEKRLFSINIRFQNYIEAFKEREKSDLKELNFYQLKVEKDSDFTIRLHHLMEL